MKQRDNAGGLNVTVVMAFGDQSWRQAMLFQAMAIQWAWRRQDDITPRCGVAKRVKLRDV